MTWGFSTGSPGLALIRYLRGRLQSGPGVGPESRLTLPASGAVSGAVTSPALPRSLRARILQLELFPHFTDAKTEAGRRKAPLDRPSPLFFCVRAISFSISEIFSRIPMLTDESGALTEPVAAAEPVAQPVAEEQQRAPGSRRRTASSCTRRSGI